MVSIGGYGYYYLKTFFDQVRPERVRLAGVVDPYPENSGHYPRLMADRVPVFSEVEEFYAAGHHADLAVISSPIQFHVPQSRMALSHGADVLCDKPIAAVIQDADALAGAARFTKRWCMIGYQWSFSRAIQALKADIRKGNFGRPRRLKTLILWPRDDAYYARNDWAGRIKDTRGRWVLDSPANNAMAHYLHNLLYLLGPETAASARPADVVAELYRVNPIENFDTAACRLHTTCGAELLFYASHATASEQQPVFQLEFENAVICFGDPAPEIIVQTSQGKMWPYGSPEDDPQFKKLFDAIDAAGTDNPPVCGPEAARAQCVCANGMQESVESIESLAAPYARRDEINKRWFVDGLDAALRECYRRNALPSELNLPWARPGKTVDLLGYTHYPMPRTP